MKSSNGFSWIDFENLRRIPLATLGVFISSFCPVQCGHCAVSASPRFVEKPSDVLIRCIEEMCHLPTLIAVAITGGEPFFELDLLKTIVDLLSNAKKRLVVYTSGYWGKADIISRVDPVLHSIDGLILGIDLYHHAYIPDEDLINALRRADEYGVWLTAQVVSGIEDPAHFEYACSVLRKAFGVGWESRVRLVRIPPAPSGRAKNIEAFKQFSGSLQEFCHSIYGPTVLRNGTFAACCNEDVVQQHGPDVYRVNYRGNFQQSLEYLESQPALSYLRKLPPLVLFSLASQCSQPGKITQPRRLCAVCWDFVNLYARLDDVQRDKFDRMVGIILAIRNNQTEQLPEVSPDGVVPRGGENI